MCFLYFFLRIILFVLFYKQSDKFTIVVQQVHQGNNDFVLHVTRYRVAEGERERAELEEILFRFIFNHRRSRRKQFNSAGKIVKVKSAGGHYRPVFYISIDPVGINIINVIYNINSHFAISFYIVNKNPPWSALSLIYRGT